jgi:hypothetical protein
VIPRETIHIHYLFSYVAHLPWTYRPEAGLTFPVRTVWIPSAELSIVADVEFINSLGELTCQGKSGQTEYAFFIHPLSERKFEGLIATYESTFDFVATPFCASTYQYHQSRMKITFHQLLATQNESHSTSLVPLSFFNQHDGDGNCASLLRDAKLIKDVNSRNAADKLKAEESN